MSPFLLFLCHRLSELANEVSDLQISSYVTFE